MTYGRPLGINDKDCNVEHPADAFESPSFFKSTEPNVSLSICYSAYQRELNKLYLIASPLIEVIFGMRVVGSSGQHVGSRYRDQILEVTSRVWTWRQQLPPNLQLDLSLDSAPVQSHTVNVNRLQALSLQLNSTVFSSSSIDLCSHNKLTTLFATKVCPRLRISHLILLRLCLIRPRHPSSSPTRQALI